MPATKTDVNPFQRRPLSTRALDTLKIIPTLPRMAYQIVMTWPRIVRQLITIIGVIAGVWGGVEAYKLYERRTLNIKVQREWVTIEDIFRTTGDSEKILEHLNAILVIKPDDPTAKTKKIALETGVGDPTDAPLMSLIYREHLKNNRIDEVIRECNSRLKYEQRDYYAHFLLAKCYWVRHAKALQEKNQKEIEATSGPLNKELDSLAIPNVNSVNINFAVLSDSLEMLRLTNRNMGIARQMIAERVLPLLKSDDFQMKADPGTQATLLSLYAEMFELPVLPQNAGEHWPAAGRMMERCLDGAKEKDDIQPAGRVASLGGRLAVALNRLKSSSQISEQVRAEYATELEERVRRAWAIVLAKDPKNIPAYTGLIESYFRTNQHTDGIKTLQKAIDATGDQPQLLQMFTQLNIHFKQEMNGYQQLKQAAERNPTQAIYWVLAAQAAAAGERRDLAADALTKAKVLSPEDPTIALMQAMIYTGTDHPHLVLAAFSVIPDAEMLRNDKAAVLFVRALSEIGDTDRLDAFLTLTLDICRKQNTALPAIWAADGLLQATPQTPQRAQHAADYLGGVVDRWRVEFPPIAVLHAQALCKAAENPDGGVDLTKSRSAIIACERALTVNPTHVPLNIGRLYLRMIGDQDPLKALEEIKPIQAKLDNLLPEQAEVVARVYNGNSKYDDAIRLIAPHTRSRATAGCWIQLGIAYHGQGRIAEAKAALDSAAAITMSDRERADYNSARVLLTRVKQ